jgi:hypothetical protein
MNAFEGSLQERESLGGLSFAGPVNIPEFPEA